METEVEVVRLPAQERHGPTAAREEVWDSLPSRATMGTP